LAHEAFAEGTFGTLRGAPCYAAGMERGLLEHWGSNMASKSADRPERARTGLAGWSAIIATWVGIMGAFGGGFMGLAKYGEEVDKMEDGKVVQTFALFEMFNSSERLASRQRIFDFMQKGGEMNNNDLYVFVDFYDALQVCVDRDLCDKDLSVRLFQSYAVPVWSEFDTQIVGGRTQSDPQFGGGLQWMAGLPAPAPSPSAVTPEPETAAEAAAPAAEPASEVASPAAASEPVEEKTAAPSP